jgi:hypothetical protein
VNNIWFIGSFSLEFGRFSQADFGKAFFVISHLSIEQSVVDNLVEAATVEGEVSPVDIGIGLLVLAELHERQSGRTVTVRDYQFAGGAEGLLTQYINRCLEIFAREDQETVLKAMLALRNPETNQRIAEGLTIDELAKEAVAEARLLKPMLDRLAQRDARLLEIVTTPGQSSAQYRLPHERLIPALYRLTGKLLAEVDQAKLKFENAFVAWQKNEAKRFLGDIGYPSELYDSQHQLKKLALTEPLNLERFTWLSSDSVEELKLSAISSSNSIVGLASLSRCHSLKKLELDLSESQVSDLEPLSKLSNLTHLNLDLSRSQVSDLEPLAKLTRLRTLSIENSTRA